MYISQIKHALLERNSFMCYPTIRQKNDKIYEGKLNITIAGRGYMLSGMHTMAK